MPGNVSPHETSIEKQRPDILKLYDISLQEYRFQVQLNWDRTKHYFLYNGALLTGAGVVLKIGESTKRVGVIAGIVLLLVCLNAASGAWVIYVGHKYYRQARDLKTKLEKELGLQDMGYALSTTPGMREAHDSTEQPVADTKKATRWISRIYVHFIGLQISIAALALFGAVWSFFFN